MTLDGVCYSASIQLCRVIHFVPAGHVQILKRMRKILPVIDPSQKAKFYFLTTGDPTE